MALIESEQASVPFVARLRARLVGLAGGESMLVQRLAGAAFLIRVASAVIAYGSQVLLARWMGGFEFGIYAYVWTWVLLLGQASDLGLAQSAQRFIPEYLERKSIPLLRGFLSGTRKFSAAMATVVAVVAAGLIWLLQGWLDQYLLIPLYLACLTLPAYALANQQDGISRSFDWFTLAFTPTYIVRQLLLAGLVGAAYAAGLPIDAVTTVLIAAFAIWATALGQMFFLNRRLAERVPAGPRDYAFKTWLTTALPIFMVEGFYLLLVYVDVLVLQHFRTPEEVAVYYAVVKTLALVSFIYWAVAATAGHRFVEYDVSGDRAGLATFLAQMIRWTFWPSLAILVLLLAAGRLILEIFGEGFAAGYPLMPILAVGLLARAAVGPIERLLNMLGQQRICALVYAIAFGCNLILCLALIPPYGMTGAAISTAIAFIVESVLLFLATKRRLGLNVFVFARPAAR